MKNFRLCCLLFVLPVWAGLDDGWRELAAENGYEEARVLFDQTEEPQDLAMIGWFLTFTGNGPDQALADAALRVLRRAPESGAAEFVLKWMEPYRECLNGFVDDAVILMADHHPQNPELLTLFASYLRTHSRFSDQKPEFVAIANGAGFLTDWLISPSFGAYPIPAFEKTWPPEQPQFWENAVRYQTRTGVVVPPREAFGSGVLYAFSQFDNPQSQEVLFRIFTYQNAALYVDGRRLGRLNHLEKIGPNIKYLSAELPAGRHEIVVKITQTRQNNGQFSLQIRAAQPPRPSTPQPPQQALGASPFREQERSVGLAAELAENDHFLAEFARAFLAIDQKDNQAALLLLEGLFESFPKSKLVGGLLARVYLDRLKFLPQEMQLSRAYQLLSQLIQEGPDHNLENHLALALLLNKANQTAAGLEMLSLVLEKNPAYCDSLEARLLYAKKQGLSDVGQQTIDLLKSMGTNHRWAQKLRLKEARREGNLVETRELLENLGELLPWEGFSAQLHDMNQDYEAAIDDLKKRREIFKNREFYPYTISKAYNKLGNRKAQRQWLEETLAVNPVHREALLDMVNLDCFEGHRQAAMDRLRAYLQVEPADGYFRQKLSHLIGETPFERYRVDSREVIEEAKNKPISEGADSELLLDQLMVRLFPDGSQMRYTHLVTRVLTKDGVDQESELRLPEGLEFLELRTIKADGSVFYPANIGNKSTISLSGVSIGDFIDEEHIEYLPPAYYDKDGLDAGMTFIFQGVDRIYHHSELVLIYPEGMQPEPKLLSRNMPGEPETYVKEGLKYVRWLTVDMPPMRTEPAMPPPSYLQPTTSFYYNTDWREIRDFYINATRTRMGLAQTLNDQLRIWQELEQDPRKLAELIYEEIVDRTEQDGQFYRNVNLVWETQSGNPTLLLTALYRSLGWDCDMALLQPEQARHFFFETPMPNYTYALLRLRLAGTTYWLDPSNKGLPFGYVPFPYRGSRALILDTTEEQLFEEVPRYDDRSERVETKYTIYIKENGSAEGFGTERFFGLFASQVARHYDTLNRPEIKQRVEAGLNQNYPGATVESVLITPNLNRGEFELTNEFKHPNLAETKENVLELPFLLPKTPMLERYGSLATRTSPVHIPTPHYNITTLELKLPQGYRWENPSQSFVKKHALGRYELAIERKQERDLVITRTYHVPAQFVPPEAYDDFLVFCRAMIENEGIRFKAVKVAGQP